MPATSDSARAANDERVVCEHADRCGGCPVIGLSYGEQLALKRGRVVQSAARYAALELVYTEPVLPARPVVGYRTRAKLIVGSGAKVGLFAKGGGHQVVDIPGCRVLAPPLARVATLLRARVAEAEQRGGPLAPHEIGERGSLRAIDLREVCEGDTSKVLVTLVVQRGCAASTEALEAAARDLLRDCADVIGVAVNFHEGDVPQVLGSRDPASGRRDGGPRSRGRLGPPGDVRLFRPGAPGSGCPRPRPARRSGGPRRRTPE